jgi:hypothetical protein
MSRITFLVLVILTVALAAWAGNTGLGTDPYSSGDELTATAINTFNNQINDNDSRIDVIEAINGIVVCDGAGNCTAAVADTDYQSVPAEGAFADGDKTKLDALDDDKIDEGDSSVEVIDSGTGQIDIDVDSEKQVQITDGYIEVINATNFRVITETDGHAMTFQVYDVSGGGAWRDALKFEHGDSGDSSATNWPRVHLGSNVALTGLGTMAVGMIWGNAGVPLTTSPTNLEAAGMNQIYKINGAIQINLPAAADVYSSGSDAAWVQFELFAASVLSLNPDGTEILRMQGTNLAAGNEIDTPATVGTIVTCIATDDVEDGSSTDGWVCRSNQTLVDGGAS